MKFTFIHEFLCSGKGNTAMDGVLNGQFPNGDFILQIDIEGSKWDSLSERSLSEENLQRITWLVLEFHDLHLFFDQSERTEMSSTITRLFALFRSSLFESQQQCMGRDDWGARHSTSHLGHYAPKRLDGPSERSREQFLESHCVPAFKGRRLASRSGMAFQLTKLVR